MNKKTVKLCSVVTAVALLLYVAACILYLLVSLLFRTAIEIPTFVPLWLSVMIPCVILLIHAIKSVKQKRGILHLIMSVVSLLIGAVWGFFDALTWVIYNVQLHAMNTFEPMFGMKFSEYYELLVALHRVNAVMVALCALGLLVIFVINWLIADQKWLQIKAELHKPVAAVMILVPALISLVQTLVSTHVLNRLGTNVYVTVSQVFGIASFAIEVLLALLLAALVLILGLVFKKQEAPADAEASPVQEQGTLPFDLPAGVSAADLDR